MPHIGAPAHAGGTPARVSLPPAPTGPGNSAGYLNPLRAIRNLVPERVDQGVDYSGTGNIYAVGPGIITQSAIGNQTGWGPPNNGIAPGGFVEERLTSGPAAGQYSYVAEGITPTVQVGQRVTAKTVIARMSAAIETGFGSGAGTQPLAQARGQLTGPVSTASGQSYSNLLHALGAPAGLVQLGGVGPGQVQTFKFVPAARPATPAIMASPAARAIRKPAKPVTTQPLRPANTSGGVTFPPAGPPRRPPPRPHRPAPRRRPPPRRRPAPRPAAGNLAASIRRFAATFRPRPAPRPAPKYYGPPHSMRRAGF